VGDPVVVVIEDEAQIRKFLRVALTGHGYRVLEAVRGEEGLIEAASRQPDLIMVDLGLPDIDGLQVIQRIREWSAVPIIVLSARGQEQDKVTALDAGADDYVSKPFAVGELLARMRVALRHHAQVDRETGESTLTLGDLHIDLGRRRVLLRDAEVHLSPIEYRLLTTLVRYGGKIVTHRQLLREVWGPNAEEQPNYVRVYMAHLRRKLESDPAQPKYLLTEPGVGYRLLTE
jgi:two-component system, OmpR family, KDP operon response regulator KdpE